MPGEMWVVSEEPVCADGINWYQVGAYDAGGWAAEGVAGRGYYLQHSDLDPAEGCFSERLDVGMRVMVGDNLLQRVRSCPGRSAPVIAWLYPGVPVTVTDGPRCAGGWVWWRVVDDRGNVDAWTPEGNNASEPWLV